MDAVEVLARQRFDVDSLNAARARATEVALHSGATEDAARWFVFAINEAMINAVMHGGGSGELTIRSGERSRLVAEVEDEGGAGGFTVPAAAPPTTSTGGRGLWLAHQVADRVTIRRGPGGTVLVVELGIGAA